MTARLFDPRVEAALATGSLFDRDALTDLFAISDQATTEDRTAATEMRKEICK